jgi:Lon protease-like protein
MAIPEVIPLFPLPGVVLFPRVSLPLHVFEPRYKKMVADALAGPRVIGMTLLRPGWESDYQGRPPLYDSGCAGHIEKWEELEHGRYNILLKGLTRFRIQDEQDGEPYRLARVQPLEDEPGDPVLMEEVRRELLAAIGRAADGPTVLVLQPELPPDVFVNALCQSLDLDPVERQSLLDCDGVSQRSRRLLEILEFRRLEQTYGGALSPRVH